tara:strand:+ start:352 stop:1671 length:1320 start_codon:yes stop_codon:yes gene_type:complete
MNSRFKSKYNPTAKQLSDMNMKEWVDRIRDLETVPVDDLKPYPQNARTHSSEQIQQIKQSIIEFGFTNPILIDKHNEIIAGHGRFESAKQLEMYAVPCIRLNDITETQKKAYVIADNKLALNADWNIDLLSEEMQNLVAEDFNIDVIGFDEAELNELLGTEEVKGLTDEDDVPDKPETPTTLKGDIYKLGNHKLMCGDATNEADVSKLMNNTKADMVFTDPPYNANYKSRGSNKLLRKGIKNDSMSNELFDNFVTDFLPSLYVSTKKGASFYICCNWKDSYPRFYFHITEANMNISSCIIWDKKSGGMGWQDYRYQYEFIIYGFKKDKSHCWYGGRTETDIWQFSREKKTKYIHPTQKPVELIEKALKNSSLSNNLILDLFGGSGSTLIACEKTKRNCYMMELDPIYCDVIIKRWEDYTGQKAELIKVDSEELLRVANV